MGGEVCAAEGAHKSDKGGRCNAAPVHGHPLEVAGGGQGSARGGSEFIGAQKRGDGGFRKKNEECGELNKAATTDNGIDQSCGKGG